MEISCRKIQILLAEKGMTQAQLAVECHVTRQNISRILGAGKCNPVTAGKIAAGLGVRVSEILKEVC